MIKNKKERKIKSWIEKEVKVEVASLRAVGTSLEMSDFVRAFHSFSTSLEMSDFVRAFHSFWLFKFYSFY